MEKRKGKYYKIGSDRIQTISIDELIDVLFAKGLLNMGDFSALEVKK